MPDTETYLVKPIGFVHSELKNKDDAPRQGEEGAPAATIELSAAVEDGLSGLEPGCELIVVSWLHEARRDVLQVHPRSDSSLPLAGVFLTRSPDRPNPIGLHRVTVLEVNGRTLTVAPLEAIDGTPILDLKVALARSGE